MSIVTLKKKSSRYIYSISDGTNGFSLNGCLRNTGYIGQTNLVKTGKLCYSNNPDVIKKTVANNSSYLSRKMVCYTADSSLNVDDYSPGKHIIGKNNWVKHMSADDYSQEKYIRERSIIYGMCVTDVIDSGANQCCTYKAGNKYVKENKQIYFKTPKVVSQGDYIQSKLMKSACLPVSKNRQHFPMYVNNTKCHNSILTVEDAIANHLLPSNWMD